MENSSYRSQIMCYKYEKRISPKKRWSKPKMNGLNFIFPTCMHMNRNNETKPLYHHRLDYSLKSFSPFCLALSAQVILCSRKYQTNSFTFFFLLIHNRNECGISFERGPPFWISIFFFWITVNKRQNMKECRKKHFSLRAKKKFSQTKDSTWHSILHIPKFSFRSLFVCAHWVLSADASHVHITLQKKNHRLFLLGFLFNKYCLSRENEISLIFFCFRFNYFIQQK